MKQIQKISSLSFALLIAMTFIFIGCQKDDQLTTTDDGTKTAINNDILGSDSTDCGCVIYPADTIYPSEIDMLTFMREEEKLARDVYTTLYAQYGTKVFDNISNSEQVHMDRVLCLLNYYGIADPASTEIGVFNNPDLQALYNSLIEQGSISLTNAFTVGATIEDVDIFDLNENLTLTENPAIITIFNNLACGSANHMRAFTKMLVNNGLTYTPQFISQVEYDAIISGESGNCGGSNNSEGNGTGGNGDGTCG